MKKCITCNRRMEELTEREKRAITRGMQDPDSDVEVNEETLSEKGTMTLTSVLHWMRGSSWDLWTACDFLRSRLRFLEKDDIKHGSCQNTYMRTTAQLVYYYNIPVECFYEWDT